MTPRQKAILGALLPISLLLAHQFAPQQTPAVVHAVLLVLVACSGLFTAFHLARAGAVTEDLVDALDGSSNAMPLSSKHPAVLAAKKMVRP